MSNIFKPDRYVPLVETKQIEALRLVFRQAPAAGEMSLEQQAEMNEAQTLKNQILHDAETFAREQIDQAMQEAAAVREQARSEIDAWWAERRSEDERCLAEAKQAGYEQGYQEGIEQAQIAVRKQYDDMLLEARTILEQAYVLKLQIIQESEPFLIELSTAIAEKIVDRQLTLEPAWTVEQIKKLLQRRKEKGTIALCVSPSQFGYIQDAREELLNAVDSQAELEILPDASVQDRGCVIRSAYGSIDARIDTQLREIKAALQEIAMRGDE
ncbi:flagellar biosynthesis protein [Gordoniibacillus kamchatkensis]|uniref:Flagellar biosynthesis protein n=1 Tax=Gordoniibacillus kamchatkensis TaxID=1590651 RepID=A0ABR5AE51_9BACL|nr:FliH/SctL family protein [Paenibacillus sp. VKM B-2647]KIL39246.1 flagellar biosynthesis protein [Paenibacillus sp. VKM B-2647]